MALRLRSQLAILGTVIAFLAVALGVLLALFGEIASGVAIIFGGLAAAFNASLLGYCLALAIDIGENARATRMILERPGSARDRQRGTQSARRPPLETEHVEPGTPADLMRQIAALYAQAANLQRDGIPLMKLRAERERLERQAAELKRRLITL